MEKLLKNSMVLESGNKKEVINSLSMAWGNNRTVTVILSRNRAIKGKISDMFKNGFSIGSDPHAICKYDEVKKIGMHAPDNRK